MFDSLDDGRRPVSRKFALVYYALYSALALAYTSLYLDRYLHRTHSQPWIYVGLVSYPIALFVSAWRLQKTWELEDTTTKESGFYFFAVLALCSVPQLIHDLLT